MLGTSERWLLWADVTNSTHFWWEIKEAGSQEPEAFDNASRAYSACMEKVFKCVPVVRSDWLDVTLGNTTGDGFILLGKHGHGGGHIREDAARILHYAPQVKTDSDSLLAGLRSGIAAVLKGKRVERRLPELRMKVVLNSGSFVTAMESGRFFGDTVNYCARVMASEVFDGWDNGIVLTKQFWEFLPDDLRNEVARFRVKIRTKYPKKELSDDCAYRIDFSVAAFWSKVKQLTEVGVSP